MFYLLDTYCIAFQGWGVSKTISHGRKLLGAYFKAYSDWKIISQLPVYAMYVCYVCILYILCIVCIVCMVCMYAMYVFYVCILCMYLMHALDLCILCMYSTYAFRIFVCKASWLSRPPGAKIHENSTCESKKVTF